MVLQKVITFSFANYKKKLEHFNIKILLSTRCKLETIKNLKLDYFKIWKVKNNCGIRHKRKLKKIRKNFIINKCKN